MTRNSPDMGSGKGIQMMRKTVLSMVAAALLTPGCAAASAHPSTAEGDHPTRFIDVHADRFYTTAVEWMTKQG